MSASLGLHLLSCKEGWETAPPSEGFDETRSFLASCSTAVLDTHIGEEAGSGKGGGRVSDLKAPPSICLSRGKRRVKMCPCRAAPAGRPPRRPGPRCPRITQNISRNDHHPIPPISGPNPGWALPLLQSRKDGAASAPWREWSRTRRCGHREAWRAKTTTWEQPACRSAPRDLAGVPSQRLP